MTGQPLCGPRTRGPPVALSEGAPSPTHGHRRQVYLQQRRSLAPLRSPTALPR